MAISYFGEQWRNGGNTTQQRLDFQISFDATSLTSGTWQDVNELDFASLINTATAAALDGNASANRIGISHTIAGLTLADGATFWIRWTDVNDSGNDHGLAIDDFSLTATLAPPPADQPPTLTATPLNPIATEGGGAVLLFSGASASTVEAGQLITAFTITVGNLGDGADELLTLGGDDMMLVDTGPTPIAGGTIIYQVIVSGATATVTFFSAGGLTAAAFEALVNGMTYLNLSENPTDGDRVVTIAYLQDNGGGTPPDDNDSVLSLASTVNVDPVNDDAIIIGALTGEVTEDGPGTAAGQVFVVDPDSPATIQAQTNVSTTYGTFSIDADGNWTYELDNSNPLVQALDDGETLADEILIESADGTDQLITITINGANEGPPVNLTIGNRVFQDVDGDGFYTAGTDIGLDGVTVELLDDVGNVLATDVTAGAGEYSFTGLGEGAYVVRVVASTLPAGFTSVPGQGDPNNGIDEDDSGEDDGSDGYFQSGLIMLTVAGGNNATVDFGFVAPNQPAIIGGDDSGDVTEDLAPATASGTLTIDDPDGADAFQAQTGTAGTYGSFSVDANGGWTYTLANFGFPVQTLGAGDTATDTFTVFAADGTAHDVVITINGTNDVAIVGGDDSAAVTEDGAISNSGTLTISDIDSGEDGFQAASGATTYGDYTIDAAGNWTFQLNNALPAVQALNNGDTLNDMFQVTTLDGTTHNVTVTINGANEPIAPPVVDLDSGTAGIDYATSYTENDTGAFIGSGLTITSHNGMINGAVIELTAATIGDLLQITGALPPGITISSQTDTQIQLQGQASAAAYAAYIGSIRYLNTTDDPTEVLEDRTVEVWVFDDQAVSQHAFASIDVIGVNDIAMLGGTVDRHRDRERPGQRRGHDHRRRPRFQRIPRAGELAHRQLWQLPDRAERLLALRAQRQQFPAGRRAGHRHVHRHLVRRLGHDRRGDHDHRPQRRAEHVRARSAQRLDDRGRRLVQRGRRHLDLRSGP